MNHSFALDLALPRRIPPLTLYPSMTMMEMTGLIGSSSDTRPIYLRPDSFSPPSRGGDCLFWTDLFQEGVGARRPSLIQQYTVKVVESARGIRRRLDRSRVRRLLPFSFFFRGSSSLEMTQVFRQCLESLASQQG